MGRERTGAAAGDLYPRSQRGKVRDWLNKEMGCTLVIDDGLGVSRSRNIGIKKCTSDFFWILDDDIYSNLEMVKSIVYSIKSKNFDIYTFRIAHDYNGTLYKKYLKRSLSGSQVRA